LKAEGRCIKPGRSVSYAEASVVNGEGKLIAHGTSTLLALPDRGLALRNEKFVT
jgi:acyl-coenzyme A thioesterase PaaI-like protein